MQKSKEPKPNLVIVNVYKIAMKRSRIALDFGTANCVIMKQGEDISLFEPTVVAIKKTSKKVVAVGTEAKELLGKEPESIIARRPLRNGGISNFQLAYELLNDFFDKVLGKYRIFSPEVIVAVPSKISSIEERALVKALEKLGVHKITLYPESMAAAIGAGLAVDEAVGNMIVNLGGGTAEIAMISYGGIVYSESHVGSGDDLTKAIQNYIRTAYGLEIGELTAERVKQVVASSIVDSDSKEVSIDGKSGMGRSSDRISITSEELVPVVREVLDKILVSIRKVINNSPSELVTDLSNTGIALSGGTSLLRNIDVFLTKSLGIPCYIVDDPINCVVRGLRSVV